MRSTVTFWKKNFKNKAFNKTLISFELYEKNNCVKCGEGTAGKGAAVCNDSGRQL